LLTFAVVNWHQSRCRLAERELDADLAVVGRGATLPGSI
jgi:hypothetical protein